jgi:chorismate mutase/prephenate dehydratase
MSDALKLNQELQPHREAIDRVDRQLLQLLNERIQHAAAIGSLKHALGSDYFDPAREAEVLERIQSLNAGPIPNEAIRAIYREIISASIGLEKQLVIAYLGPPATFTHQAALKSFGGSLNYLPMRTIADVFIEVERGRADYGVIPIENSTEGAVFHSLDRLVESDLKIVAQEYLPIEHCLIASCSMDAIREVHSKDQALGQCRNWLRTHLPHAVLVDNHSTSGAVEKARDNAAEGVAAVASSLAAELYDLPILARGIQDANDNVTRFLTIGKTVSRPRGSGRDKTSLVISINDRPGALLDALRPFSELGLNLTKIESRPSRRKAWDYIFFIDVIGHYEDPVVRQAIDRLRDTCPMVKWLGSYPNFDSSKTAD